MSEPPRRLRLIAALPLWAVLTRAIVRDNAQTAPGVRAVLLCASFFFYVARAQIPWLGIPIKSWWHVGCRAEIAAFCAMTSPQSLFFPVLVFVVVFRLLRQNEALLSSAHGGPLWRCIPIILLLHPRWGYSLDVIGVTALMMTRHFEPAKSVCDQTQFHREHERRAAVDVLGALVLSGAGAPLTTRAALALGTIALAALIHLKYPRKNVGYFDAVNEANVPRYMNIPWRLVGGVK